MAGALSRRRLAAAAAGAVAAVVGWVATAPAPGPLLDRAGPAAVRVVDRYGRLVRLVPDSAGMRSAPVDLDRVTPYLPAAVLAAEDRRFAVHPGVDPISLLRAAWQDLRAGSVVSGGSTVTMQLARLLDPRPRTVAAKVAQIRLALRLEAELSKEEILEAYLERVPMGNRVVGVEAAARVYLGKPAAQLSPAEAALLAVVPRSPSRHNPWTGTAELRARRDRVLRRLERSGKLSPAAAAAARCEPVVLAGAPFRFEAPHLVRRVLGEVGALTGDAVVVATTADLELQRRVEAIVGRHLDQLADEGVGQIAVAVLDVGRGEWTALEGSGGFWTRAGGEIDGTRAARQPGSALKPFTYAAAFDRGVTPATILADLPTAFAWSAGTWAPRNYDGRYHGPLRARQALACSVNVPAAALLAEVGTSELLDVLHAAGLDTLDRGADEYGLGLTLGAGEVRLDQLTAAFAALLRGGEWRLPTAWTAARDAAGTVVARPPVPPQRRVCSREAAAQVVDVLADPDARAPAFGRWSVLRLPFRAAVKTGTSEGFRDNWCVGGTREVAVGVWCGSFDRAPMGNLSGVAGAGTVWREVMLAWADLAHPGVAVEDVPGPPPPPPSLVRTPVCALSGLAPSRLCPVTVDELLRPEEVPTRRCDWHREGEHGVVRAWPARFRAWAAAQGFPDGDAAVAEASSAAPLTVTAPVDRDAYVVSPDLPRRFQTVELRCAVSGSPDAVVWRVDGRAVATAPPPYTASWVLEPGTHTVDAVAGALRARPVVITVYGP